MLCGIMWRIKPCTGARVFVCITDKLNNVNNSVLQTYAKSKQHVYIYIYHIVRTVIEFRGQTLNVGTLLKFT